MPPYPAPAPFGAPPRSVRPHTKIVATLGPASEGRIGELIDAGMSVARVNFSHGNLDEHRRRVERVRTEAAGRMVGVGILADLPGPKMRLARFEGGQRTLSAGEIVRVRQGDGIAAAGEVLFNFGGYLEAVEPGHRMVLADGLVELLVEEVRGDEILARVHRAGPLGDRKGVHLPDSPVAYELPTEEDRRHIEVARELGVDYLGVSFVGRAEELVEIRRLAPEPLLVAKIERKAALFRLDAILKETDGVMVARGDLGVEVELEQVPMLQKSLLADSLRQGKFTITATEMLESMVHSSRPTRAEVNDVANAVFDGTDAIMLSAETAVGRHPVEVVATATRIVAAVEASDRYRDLPRVDFREQERDVANAIAMAVVRAAEALEVSRIVCFTETGNTVRLISRYRPRAEVVALSPHPRTVNSAAILAHVRPMLFRRERSIEDMLFMASKMLEERGICRRGEEILFVAGVPPGVAKSTNMIKHHRIGEDFRFH
jgi:pyruvate kinase